MPKKLEQCVKKVEKQSPDVNPWAVCQTTLKGEAMTDEDMLVYPEEFKSGMKEEKEHRDVIGNDKEALKKIVLAHLKEDSRYYSKLSTAMKAEEAMKPTYPAKPAGYKMSPKEEVETKIHLNPAKAEYNPAAGGKILAPIKKSAEEAEKKPRVIPGTQAPKTRAYLKERKLLAEEEFTPHSKTPGRETQPKDTSSPPSTPGKTRPQWQKDLDAESHTAEEDSPREKLINTPRFIKHQQKDRDTAIMNRTKKLQAEERYEPSIKSKKFVDGKKETFPEKMNVSMKSEEASPREQLMSTPGFIKHQQQDRDHAKMMQSIPKKAEEEPVRFRKKIDDSKVSPLVKSYSDMKLPTTQVRKAEEEKLSSKLLRKAEEEIGKDKVEESKNRTVIDNFVEEEKKKAEEIAKPPQFIADPAKAGLMDKIMKKLDPAPAKPASTSLPSITKKTIHAYKH